MAVLRVGLGVFLLPLEDATIGAEASGSEAGQGGVEFGPKGGVAVELGGGLAGGGDGGGFGGVSPGVSGGVRSG